MEGAKRTPLSARKKPMRKSRRRLVRSIVAYLKSGAYLYAPLFLEDLPVAGVEAMEIERVKKKNNKRRMFEKVKEYLKSDCYMYTPMITPGSLLKGKTMRDDHMNLRSDIAEHTLHNGRISSPKRSLVILEGQRAELSREINVSSPFSSQPEDPRRVPTK